MNIKTINIKKLYDILIQFPIDVINIIFSYYKKPSFDDYMNELKDIYTVIEEYNHNIEEYIYQTNKVISREEIKRLKYIINDAGLNWFYIYLITPMDDNESNNLFNFTRKYNTTCLYQLTISYYFTILILLLSNEPFCGKNKFKCLLCKNIYPNLFSVSLSNNKKKPYLEGLCYECDLIEDI